MVFFSAIVNPGGRAVALSMERVMDDFGLLVLLPKRVPQTAVCRKITNRRLP